jgi:hypothetical protein
LHPDSVNASSLQGALLDEARLLEDAKVPRDRRSAHRKHARKLTDGERACAQPAQDLATDRIAECVQSVHHW